MFWRPERLWGSLGEGKMGSRQGLGDPITLLGGVNGVQEATLGTTRGVKEACDASGSKGRLGRPQEGEGNKNMRGPGGPKPF